MCIRDRRYPTVMHQYSGPDSQEVLDQFYIGWEYALAQAGYVEMCIRDSVWRCVR